MSIKVNNQNHSTALERNIEEPGEEVFTTELTGTCRDEERLIEISKKKESLTTRSHYISKELSESQRLFRHRRVGRVEEICTSHIVEIHQIKSQIDLLIRQRDAAVLRFRKDQHSYAKYLWATLGLHRDYREIANLNIKISELKSLKEFHQSTIKEHHDCLRKPPSDIEIADPFLSEFQGSILYLSREKNEIKEQLNTLLLEEQNIRDNMR